MKKAAQILKDNIFQVIAIAILMSAMLSASKRAALPALWAIGRFIMPVLVILLIFKFIKSRVSNAVQKFQQQMMQGMQNAGAGQGISREKGQVLDMCPKCGGLQNAGHRCA